jgi:hypothetical protein
VESEFVESYIAGIERYISSKEKDLIVRGRVDSLYSNIIVEFESDLNRKLSESIRQLKTYASFTWSNETKNKSMLLGIATDGIKFKVYTPLHRLKSQHLLMSS